MPIGDLWYVPGRGIISQDTTDDAAWRKRFPGGTWAGSAPKKELSDMKTELSANGGTTTTTSPDGTTTTTTVKSAAEIEVERKLKEAQTKAAKDGLNKYLASYGISGSAAASIVADWDKHANLGLDYSTWATTYLPQTQAYQNRFVANATRIKNGLAELTPQQYVAMENSYRNILETYKMPKGFYDDPRNDFASWIANDVSPNEIQNRVTVAYDWANTADQETKDALKKYYGVGTAEIAAYALDRKRALPLLEKQAGAVKIGSEALRSDLTSIGRGFAEILVDQGIGQQQARQAFGTTAASLATAGVLSGIEGQAVGTKEIAGAVLGTDAAAQRKVTGLASRERARFGGSSGGTNILGQDTAGQF